MAQRIVTVFRNSDFIIVDKPHGVLSVPARFADDTRPCIGIQLQQELQQQVYPTHRLDFEVSGLLMFALNPQAHAAANSWFEHKQIKKIYQALTEGAKPTEKNFEWKAKVLRGKKRTYESPVGKESITQAECLGFYQGHLHWRLYPVTGRSHQLRFDLSRHGYPILGDKLYGSKIEYQTMEPAIALRAVQIIFPTEAKKFGLPDDLLVEGLFS